MLDYILEQQCSFRGTAKASTQGQHLTMSLLKHKSQVSAIYIELDTIMLNGLLSTAVLDTSNVTVACLSEVMMQAALTPSCAHCSVRNL